MRRPGGTPARNDALGADVIAGDALMLWSTRTLRRPMRLPDAADVLTLLAGGQRPGAQCVGPGGSGR